MRDICYQTLSYRPSEIEHHYGERVHILADPFAATQLARLCEARTHQPDVNRLVRRLYERLLVEWVNQRLPRSLRRVPTRMAESSGERGVLESELIEVGAQVVSVDIARAGIVPSLVCYELLNGLLDPAGVRQDHLMVSRVVNDADQVQGAEITGGKIGGPVVGRDVLFPDPMGATGASLSAAIDYYKRTHGGGARSMTTLNLIVTPEFIRCITETHPEVEVFALRLDRGASSEEVLATTPGERWDEESGLNDRDYIVPGGGGFGELMNNAWV